MSVFRVLVTGGRGYENAVEVQRALDSVVGRYGLPTVIHGGATGADTALTYLTHPATGGSFDSE